ncbi:hypothetical protein ACQP3F_26570, partial [Escherichia coli]
MSVYPCPGYLKTFYRLWASTHKRQTHKNINIKGSDPLIKKKSLKLSEVAGKFLIPEFVPEIATLRVILVFNPLPI